MIFREALAGFVLWSCASADYRVRVSGFALVFLILVAATRRFGLSCPTTWRGVLFEAALVFYGALGVANLAGFLHGPPPWIAGR